MKTLLRNRTTTILAAGAIGLMALSGCSDMGSDSKSGDTETQSSDTAESGDAPEESGDAAMAGGDLVGPGCAAYAEANPDG
ncbi:MAG: fasciclin domain-containing protein, partial [Brevibacterium sp.]|nr:fasciclin domain-containing protein [Brevibacterium sp.]